MQHPKRELQQQYPRPGSGRAERFHFGLHSSDILAKGPVLTSPRWDRLPCWVSLWENSSSLGRECDPVTGRPLQPGVRVHLQGLPLHRGTRIPSPQTQPAPAPRHSWASSCWPRRRAAHLHAIRTGRRPRPCSPWLHAADTLQWMRSPQIPPPPAQKRVGFPTAQEHIRHPRPSQGAPRQGSRWHALALAAGQRADAGHAGWMEHQDPPEGAQPAAGISCRHQSLWTVDTCSHPCSRNRIKVQMLPLTFLSARNSPLSADCIPLPTTECQGRPRGDGERKMKN